MIFEYWYWSCNHHWCRPQVLESISVYPFHLIIPTQAINGCFSQLPNLCWLEMSHRSLVLDSTYTRYTVHFPGSCENVHVVIRKVGKVGNYEMTGLSVGPCGWNSIPTSLVRQAHPGYKVRWVISGEADSKCSCLTLWPINFSCLFLLQLEHIESLTSQTQEINIVTATHVWGIGGTLVYGAQKGPEVNFYCTGI